MSTKLYVPVLLLAALFVFGLSGTARAGVVPVLAVNTLVTDVSAVDDASASALFAEDALVTNSLNGRTYIGTAEIDGLLDEWQRPGRSYEVVALFMDGDNVDATVAISDRGIVWAQQTMTAKVSDGLIDTLQITGFRFTFPMLR